MQDDRGHGASNTASPLYLPWQSVSALASETDQAVWQTFSDSGIGTSGHVQQGLQYHVPSSKPSENLPQFQASFIDGGQADCNIEDTSPDVLDREAVQADVSRVKTKMVSTNAATEVILRFNFMGARESKVRLCCQGSDLTRDLRCAITPPLCAGCVAVSGGINHGGSCCVGNRVCEEDAGGRPMLSCSVWLPFFCCPMMPTHQSFLLRDTILLQSPDAKSYACGALLLAALVG